VLDLVSHGLHAHSGAVSAEKAKRARRRAKKKLEKQSVSASGLLWVILLISRVVESPPAVRCCLQGAGNQSNAANGSTVEDDDVDMAPVPIPDCH